MTTLITLPHTGLQVPHRDLHVTSLKEFPTSRGVAFTATLRLRRTIVGTVEDAGVGGGARFEPKNRNTFGHTEMDDFAAQCVLRWDSGPPQTEFVLGDLVEEYDVQRTINRYLKQGRLICRRMQPIAPDATDLIQRETLTIANASLPTTADQLLALGRQCALHTGEAPGDIWQAWNPAAEQWIDLLTIAHPA